MLRERTVRDGCLRERDWCSIHHPDEALASGKAVLVPGAGVAGVCMRNLNMLFRKIAGPSDQSQALIRPDPCPWEVMSNVESALSAGKSLGATIA